MRNVFSIALLAFVLFFSSCNRRPDCTIREVGNGVFEPYGNCNNCSSITIMGMNGSQSMMGMDEAYAYTRANPMMEGYRDGGSSLNNILLYHFLFNSPRANTYRNYYPNQYSNYNNYNRQYNQRTSPSYNNSPQTTRRMSNGEYKDALRSNSRTTGGMSRSYSTPTPNRYSNPSYNRPSGGMSRSYSKPSNQYSGSRTSGGMSRSYSSPSRSSSSSSSRSSGGMSRH